MALNKSIRLKWINIPLLREKYGTLQYQVNGLEIMYKDELVPLTKQEVAVGFIAPTRISNRW